MRAGVGCQVKTKSILDDVPRRPLERRPGETFWSALRRKLGGESARLSRDDWWDWHNAEREKRGLLPEKAPPWLQDWLVETWSFIPPNPNVKNSQFIVLSAAYLSFLRDKASGGFGWSIESFVLSSFWRKAKNFDFSG